MHWKYSLLLTFMFYFIFWFLKLMELVTTVSARAQAQIISVMDSRTATTNHTRSLHFLFVVVVASNDLHKHALLEQSNWFGIFPVEIVKYRYRDRASHLKCNWTDTRRASIFSCGVVSYLYFGLESEWQYEMCVVVRNHMYINNKQMHMCKNANAQNTPEQFLSVVYHFSQWYAVICHTNTHSTAIM